MNGEYLTLVGKSSVPRQFSVLKPMAVRKLKMQERMELPRLLRMAQIKQAAAPDPTILKTVDKYPRYRHNQLQFFD